MNLSASNLALWSWLTTLGLIALALLAANLLLGAVPFLKKSLMPTAVLGGFLLLALRCVNLIVIDRVLLEALAYHGIAVGFIALSLKVRPGGSGNGDKSGALLPLKNGALIAGTYLLQGILGMGVSLGLYATFRPGLFPAAGILLPMGYGQGPGQANNIGGIYESLGFAGGRSFGLSLAAAGYLSACVVGVIYLNVSTRKSGFKPAQNVGKGEGTAAPESAGEIMANDSVDRLSIQTALVLVSYLLTYGLIFGLTTLLGRYAPGAAAALSALLWGFNFMVGIGVAQPIKLVLEKLHQRRLIKRQYQDNFLLSRISGFTFDIMIVAAIASINISDLNGLWLPFILMSLLGAFATLWYLRWLCPKIYPNHKYEGILSMYGMLTGTISSGILLLREIDPQLESPAVYNLVSGSGTAILFGAPVLAFVGLAPQSVPLALSALGLMCVYFLVLTMFMAKSGKR